MAKRPSKPKAVVRERTSSVADLAAFAGVHRTTIYEWQKIPGYPKAADGTVCKWDLCDWVRSREAGELQSGSGDEMEGVVEGSYWLEQFRKQRAGIAELELEQKKGNLIDRATIHSSIMRVASIFRDGFDNLQRQYGPDVYRSICHTWSNAVSTVRREFGREGVDGDTDGPNVA